MTGKIIGEGAAPVVHWTRRRLPFIATAVAAAIAGGAVYALAWGGDDDSAAAQPGTPAALAGGPAPGYLPPGPPESLRLPPPGAFPVHERPDIGRAFRECMSEHGVSPRPRRGHWTKASRPDPKTLNRALHACVYAVPRPPYPIPRRG